MKQMTYRKTGRAVLALTLLSSFCGCAKSDPSSEDDMIRLEFVIPPEAEAGYYYAEEEISTSKDTFTILAEDDVPEAELILEPVDEQESSMYQPSEIGAGKTLELLIRKDTWYRVGIRTDNSGSDPLQLHLQVKDADTRKEP